MKKRSLLLLIALTVVFVISIRNNGVIKSFFLDFINPIKSAYLNLTNISDSYLEQQKSITTLQKENARLNKLLLEQSNYLEQLSKIYKLLPSLSKKPYKSIYLVDTISYIKLNRLNEIMLSSPTNLKVKKDKLYGLMQKDVASGISREIDGKLYGYLLSHPKCTFSVIIGSENISGIAQGNDKGGMIVKFIPRWSNIKIGDSVKTSGLDNIFFPNTPVGTVTDVKTLDTYKLATIKVFANLSKPKLFFLISDATPYLTTDYVPKTSFPNRVYPYIPKKNSDSTNEAQQTKDSTIEPQIVNEVDYLKVINTDFIWNNKLEFQEEHHNN
jgi:rod shape-determining protein MreC